MTRVKNLHVIANDAVHVYDFTPSLSTNPQGEAGACMSEVF